MLLPPVINLLVNGVKPCCSKKVSLVKNVCTDESLAAESPLDAPFQNEMPLSIDQLLLLCSALPKAKIPWLLALAQ
jgi:hypothetical protein